MLGGFTLHTVCGYFYSHGQTGGRNSVITIVFVFSLSTLSDCELPTIWSLVTEPSMSITMSCGFLLAVMNMAVMNICTFQLAIQDSVCPTYLEAESQSRA